MNSGNTLGDHASGLEYIEVDPDQLEFSISSILEEKSLSGKKEKVQELSEIISRSKAVKSKGPVRIRSDSFERQISQMLESRTAERLDYYARRMARSVLEVVTSEYSDINLRRWRDYSHIRTDSLWLFDRRGKGEGQDASYWGNFIPEIPQQLIERYTKEGEWVLDPFLGSGTTMLESIRLGRNCIGIDLNENAVSLVRGKFSRMDVHGNPERYIIREDSRNISPEMLQKRTGRKSVQLAILHPPYHDIVKFSDMKEDLSGAETVGEFLSMFSEIMHSVDSVLDPGRFLAIVIGDKYSGGELVPLSHMVSAIATDMGYAFKSIIVKNFEKTRGKRGSEMLWKYRALAGGFYVFKHEYILVFRKAG